MKGLQLIAGVAVCVIGLGPSLGASAQEQDAATPKERFEIREFRVLGSTVLDVISVERAVYPFLGGDRDIDAVEQARQSLEKAFKDRGYGTVFVDIPEQDIVDGVVRLKVTEGRLDRIRVTGGRYFSNGQIRREMTSLARGEVPLLSAVQEQLAHINQQSADRSVTPILRAGRTPGTVDVELKVQDELPLHGSFEVNDRYTADTSRLRASVNLSFDNLFQRNHSFAFQHQRAPEEPDEAKVFAATYLARLGNGDVVALYGVDTDSDVATVGTLSVLGRGRIYGARYIKPLEAAATRFHSVSFGADYKDFEENVLLSDSDPLNTPISYLAWSAVYAGGAQQEKRMTSFSIGSYFGLRGAQNDSAEFAAKRAQSQTNYFYLRGSVEHLRELWKGFGAYWRLAGQFATAALISNEQFAIGGADSVRGYLESEQLGDLGLSGSIELRTPSLWPSAADAVQQFYLLGFYDAGVVQFIDPLGAELTQLDLSSVGAGLRFSGFYGLQLALDWAYPLVPSTRVEDGDARFHFAVKYGF